MNPRRTRWIRLGPLGLGVSLPARRDGANPTGRAGATAREAWKNGRTVPEAPPAKPVVSLEPGSDALRAGAQAIDWYHTIDLGHGVVTEGLVDHRPQLPSYHLPESLRGMRCLDVASMDGFWSFELERRGADEVVAIDVARRSDLDLPYGVRDEIIKNGQDGAATAGFEFAHKSLASKVHKRIVSVYELSPERVGEFDLIFLSDLLLHLRDPQTALERVRSVCRGVAYVADVCHPDLETSDSTCLAEYPTWVPGEYVWWRMNANTIRAMLFEAGFEAVEELARFRLNVPGAKAESLPAKVVFRASVGAQRRAAQPQRLVAVK
jgi:tRNA (mo5U34)-methyltransferase